MLRTARRGLMSAANCWPSAVILMCSALIHKSFFVVEAAGRGGNVFQVKPSHKLRHAEKSIVAVRPAQPRQIVEQRYGQIPWRS